MKQAQASEKTVLRKKNAFSRMLAQWDLQILLVPGILLVLLFSYVPMYGVVMGFQDFQLGDFPGFSQWVGFKHFQTMFADKYFGLAMRNTLVISALKMFIGFPLPIFLRSAAERNELPAAEKNGSDRQLPAALHLLGCMCNVDV